MRPSTGSLAVRYGVLSLLAVAFLLPFYVIVRNAFSTQRHITASTWHWWPDAIGTDVLVKVLGDPGVGLPRALAVSLLVTGLQTVLTVVVCGMAGYGLARFRNRASRVILAMTVFTLMVPATVTFVPSFVMVSSLGWISSLRGLVIPGVFSAFATYLFTAHFRGFPVELEEAARIDGASIGRTFVEVVVPNSLGMVGAVATITFIGSWNAFLWPLLIAQDPQMRTVQVVLSQFMTSQGVQYPELFTGALVALAPSLVVFLFLQRFLVQGVEQTGIR